MISYRLVLAFLDFEDFLERRSQVIVHNLMEGAHCPLCEGLGSILWALKIVFHRFKKIARSRGRGFEL